MRNPFTRTKHIQDTQNAPKSHEETIFQSSSQSRTKASQESKMQPGYGEGQCLGRRLLRRFFFLSFSISSDAAVVNRSTNPFAATTGSAIREPKSPKNKNKKKAKNQNKKNQKKEERTDLNPRSGKLFTIT